MHQTSWSTLLTLSVAITGCSDSGNDAAESGTTIGTQSTGGMSTGPAATTQTAGQTTGTAAATTGLATNSGGAGAAGGATTEASTTVGPSVANSSGGGGGGNEDATAAGGTTNSVGGAESSTTAAATTMGDLDGPCTASEPVGANASGSGPHEVVVETNADPGIDEGTIFRPADLAAGELYPIFVWGEGGCSQDGLSNQTAMVEIASHGYFVVADGTPSGSGNRPMDRSDMEAMGAPLIGYIDWALDENRKPCSAYYQALDANKIASNGFSCGGLMAQGTITDPRITTWGVTSSGMAGASQAFYDAIHTPVLFVEGGPAEVAYDGGLEGYQAISELGVPVLWFSKDLGHGGDLFQPDGGDFTKINLAWLNWWLKGDETATGKGLLVGDSCSYCTDSEWEVLSANVP